MLADAAEAPTSDIIVMTDPNHTKFAGKFAGYDERRFRFRVWWVRDYGKTFRFDSWKNWFEHRTPWNPTGGMPEWLLIKKG